MTPLDIDIGEMIEDVTDRINRKLDAADRTNMVQQSIDSGRVERAVLLLVLAVTEQGKELCKELSRLRVWKNEEES